MNNAYTEFHENTTDNLAADIKSQMDRHGLTSIELVSGLGISYLPPFVILLEHLHLLTLNLKMVVACASETLATQPTAKDENPPNRKNINNESLLKLKPGRKSSTAIF